MQNANRGDICFANITAEASLYTVIVRCEIITTLSKIKGQHG